MNGTIRKSRSILIFSIFAVIQSALILFSGVHEDEPYYWDWTRFLSWGYFDHPPMTAWIISALQPLFGMGPITLKIAASLCAVGAAGALSLIVLRAKPRTDAPLILLLLLWLGTPVFGILSSFMTPDLPLFLFWSISLALGVRIAESQKSSLWEWIALGISCSLGMYSKYTFVLFFPVFLGMLLISRRDLFKGFGPYLWLITAVSVGIPHLLWNQANNWPSIRFQADHGIGSQGVQFAYLGEYLSAQLGLFNPLLAVVLICAAVHFIRKKSSAGTVLLVLSAIVPILFFGAASLTKRGNANWPAMAFLGALVLIALYWNSGAGTKMRRFIAVSLGIGLIFTGIIDAQKIRPIIPVQSVVNELFGWEEFAEQIDQLIIDARRTAYPLTANSYQTAGTLGLYLKNHPRVYAINLGSRTNHYAFLPERAKAVSGKFLFVQEVSESGDMPEFMVPFFRTVVYHGSADLIQGTKVKHYGLFEVQLADPKSLN